MSGDLAMSYSIYEIADKCMNLHGIAYKCTSSLDGTTKPISCHLVNQYFDIHDYIMFYFFFSHSTFSLDLTNM